MNFYLQKYGFRSPQINANPKKELGIAVVIPSFNEPDIRSTIRALNNCERPDCSVEVIVVVNCSENASDDIRSQNKNTLSQLDTLKDEVWFDLHVIDEQHLPKKHAGVGLARKIGMDEAVARFDRLGRDGIIVCFDADSRCTANYLSQIERHFASNAKSPGCSIYYEHPLEGNEFSAEVYLGIIEYELHLRYYKLALEFAGLPYAYHTVGSSMAVRSSAYQKQGGMNKRKAGEDFYFLNKIIMLGDFTELKSTCVIPSPRESDRVPFGTGRAIMEYLDQKSGTFLTYDFRSFQLIKELINSLVDIYSGKNYSSGDKIFDKFIQDNEYQEVIKECLAHSSSYKTFSKRFYQWFDAFKVLKLVHYLRDHQYPNVTVLSQVNILLHESGHAEVPSNSKEALQLLREIERA